ncbi:MAG: GWxTD domain-containing protein, partial [Candidatus Aminicenantales bacterium]
FIENFWKKRDPNPATPENEFKIAYYRRIAFANKFFGTAGIPGWRTDRGRIFILLGAPNEVQNDYLASRDSLSQPGAIEETWTYWDLPNPNLPYSLEFTFIDRYGTGNYELATGRGYRDNASFALDLDAVHAYFNEMEILAEAMHNPFEKAEKLREVITTQVNYDLVPFSCDLYSRKASEDKSQTIISLTIPIEPLEASKRQGKNDYSLTLIVTLSNELGQGLFEKTQEISFGQDAAQQSGLSLSEYFLPLSLVTAPGTYGLHLLLLDNNSGKIGTMHKQIEVPHFGKKGLALSDIILASSDPDPAESQRPLRLRPRGAFRSDETVQLEFEVYNVSLDPENKKGHLCVKFFSIKIRS